MHSFFAFSPLQPHNDARQHTTANQQILAFWSHLQKKSRSQRTSQAVSKAAVFESGWLRPRSYLQLRPTFPASPSHQPSAHIHQKGIPHLPILQELSANLLLHNFVHLFFTVASWVLATLHSLICGQSSNQPSTTQRHHYKTHVGFAVMKI